MRYHSILLKLSGEALGGEQGQGLDAEVLRFVVSEIESIVRLGVKVAVVIGAGNLIRGKDLIPFLGQDGLQKVTADQMGMLATIQNSLALRDVLVASGVRTKLFSTHGMPSVVTTYSVEEAKQALESGEVVLCAGGTGNPLYTTDSAACLRGIELGVDVVVKGTQVDGVYESDPQSNPEAKRYEQLSFNQMLELQLKVIDLTASALCLEHGMSVIVYRLASKGGLARIVEGSGEGTLIST